MSLVQSPAYVNSFASRLLLYAVFAEYLHFVQTPLAIFPPHLGHVFFAFNFAFEDKTIYFLSSKLMWHESCFDQFLQVAYLHRLGPDYIGRSNDPYKLSVFHDGKLGDVFLIHDL